MLKLIKGQYIKVGEGSLTIGIKTDIPLTDDEYIIISFDSMGKNKYILKSGTDRAEINNKNRVSNGIYISTNSDKNITVTVISGIVSNIVSLLMNAGILVSSVNNMVGDVIIKAHDIDRENLPKTVETSLIDVESSLNVVVDRLTTLENTTSVLVSDVNAIKNGIPVLNGRLDAIEADIVTITSELGTLSTTVSELDTELTSLTTVVNGHTTSIADIETDITGINNSISSINNSIGTLTTNLTNLTTDVSNLTLRVTNVETANTNQDAAISTLQTNLTNLSNATFKSVLLCSRRKPDIISIFPITATKANIKTYENEYLVDPLKSFYYKTTNGRISISPNNENIIKVDNTGNSNKFILNLNIRFFAKNTNVTDTILNAKLMMPVSDTDLTSPTQLFTRDWQITQDRDDTYIYMDELYYEVPANTIKYFYVEYIANANTIEYHGSTLEFIEYK